MSLLFTPIQIKNLSLKNRLVVSPMCQYTAVDGFANNWHLVHLGSRASGGAALVIQEATAISPEGRISPGDLGIWSDEHLPMLRQITSFIQSQHSIPGIQLAHAGRKASFDVPWKGSQQLNSQQGGWETVAPSAISYYPDNIPPVELDIEGITKVRADFKAAVKRSIAAGYEVIEIHAAHGYLLHEFLSPLTNLRTDQYGGSLENRSRLLLEIVADTRKLWPAEKALFVRISATDWAPGGWSLEEAVQLSAMLKANDVDVIDCSSGGNIHEQQIVLGPGYQVPFSETIKKETGMLCAAVGLIDHAQQAENILQSGQADLICIGREFLRDPYFALHAAAELGDDIKWPDQYLRAKPAK